MVQVAVQNNTSKALLLFLFVLLVFLLLLLLLLLLFLGAFAKFRKATISFVMSVCPSVYLSAWNNSAPTGQIFIEFDTYFSSICRESSSLIKI